MFKKKKKTRKKIGKVYLNWETRDSNKTHKKLKIIYGNF